ncbi:MAG: DUF4407 domain-containing protein [Bacteroidia bacterium]|nr:DUF4407 domain-containing protein [Bacteroidia bacterium]
MKKERNMFQELLWNISGHKKEIIENCETDKYSASIIGALLVIVGIYATIAWTFFIGTVSNASALLIIPFGIFAGLFIVCFDRAIISSMASGKSSLFALAFRFVLAIILGMFLSQPVILKLYESDIKKEANILFDKKVQEHQLVLQDQYAVEIEALNENKDALYTQLIDKEKRLDKSKEDFKSEMDGSGGSGIRGYSTISKKKEKIYAEDLENLSILNERNTSEIAGIDNRLNEIQSEINTATADYKSDNANLGFLIQVEALESLFIKDDTGTLKERYLLLSLILILIELSALIAKLMLKTNSYKEKAQHITDQELAETALAKEIALSKIQATKENSIELENEMMAMFFEASKDVTKEKLATMVEEWRAKNETGLKYYWKKFKQEYTLQ